jgi:serine phosphatase RsbU (regulator of sigma subunit)
MVVHSLYFQREYYGLIGFDANHSDGQVYEELAEYVGSALHSALLLKKVHQQTIVLSHANEELNKLRAKEHAYIESVNRELALGRKIQRGFLPETLPRLPGWEIASSFIPARAVSGDLYDTFFLGDNFLALVIADVVGKDISAALFMSILWTLIRALSERAYAEGDDPIEIVHIINNFLHKHYSQCKDRQMYATLFLGLLDLSSGELRYCNAGHYPPKIMLHSKIHAELWPTGPAVGISPEATYKLSSIELPKSGLFCAYTDGVLEARNIDGDFFTAERLNDLLRRDYRSASSKIGQIEKALKKHIGKADPFDDITMLAVKRT